MLLNTLNPDGEQVHVFLCYYQIIRDSVKKGSCHLYKGIFDFIEHLTLFDYSSIIMGQLAVFDHSQSVTLCGS